VVKKASAIPPKLGKESAMEKQVKLNTKKLLGFRLVSRDAAASSRIGAKIGGKMGMAKKPH
jgi:hypothetical protein